VGALTNSFAQGAATWSDVNWAIAMMVGAQLAISVLTYQQRRLEGNLTVAMTQALTLDMVNRLLRFSADFFREREVERILTPALEDTNRLARVWIDAVIQFPLACATLLIVGGLMLAENWFLGGCMVLLSLLSTHFVLF